MPPSNSGVTVIISGQDDLGPVLDRLEERLAAAGQAGNRAGEGIAGGMGHGYTATIAASGALQTFEGRIPIRAVERFLTMIPGVGAALMAAFPVIGLVDFARVAVNAGQELVAFYRNAQNAGGLIAQAYRDAHTSAALANDDLRIQNDRLDNEIAKLEHKPQNNLKLALDEDRKAADEAASSLEKMSKASADALKDKGVSAFKASFTGQASTSEVEGSVKSFQQQISGLGDSVSDAAAGGNQTALAQARKNLTDKQNAYRAWLQQQIKERQDEQNAAQAEARLYGTRNDNDQTANLSILRGELTAQNDERDKQTLQAGIAQKTPVVAELQQKKSDSEAANRAAELQNRMTEARQQVASAKAQLQEAEDKREADAAKSQADFLNAANEDAHKRQLESDEQYYRDKADIANGYVEAQRAAIAAQISSEQQRISGLQGEKFAGPDAGAKSTERDAKVLEARAKIVALDGKDAELTGQIAKNTAQLADELDALAKKRQQTSDDLAARLETERGGSTMARAQQSSDKYIQQRSQLVQEFGGEDNDAVRNLDAQQNVDQAGIGVQGAQQTFNVADAQIQAQRKGVDDAAERGQISGQAAQQERIALDREEAQALQPVLAAYQQLAAAGDIDATAKVAELQQRIAALQEPVNQVAIEMRNQFDSAFETLFVNLDKGEKAWKQFGKSLKSDVMKDAYQQLVAPVLQTGMAAVIGGANRAAGGGGGAMSKVGGAPTVASAIGGFASKFLGLPSGTAKGAAGAGSVSVNLINNTTQPAQADASQGGGGDGMTDALEPHVVTIVLKNLESGGSIGQAISGISSMFS